MAIWATISPAWKNCRARDDRIFYPTHGSPIANPQDWLAPADRPSPHAGRRRFVSALAGGAQTVRGWWRSFIPDLQAALRPAAAQQVVAHLKHLQARGEAAPEAGCWTAYSLKSRKKALIRASVAAMVQIAVAALGPHIHPAADGARRAHPDHDVADAPEPEAPVGGFDAHIFLVGIHQGPAQIFHPLEAAPIGFLRRHQQAGMRLGQGGVFVVQGIGDGDLLALIGNRCARPSKTRLLAGWILARATNWGGSSGSVVTSWMGSA